MYRVTVKSSEFGYHQADHKTRKAAVAQLIRFAVWALSLNGGNGFTLTIAKE